MKRKSQMCCKKIGWKLSKDTRLKLEVPDYRYWFNSLHNTTVENADIDGIYLEFNEKDYI